MERFESVIGTLYEAAAGQKSWAAALTELSSATGSYGSVLVSFTDRGRLLGSSDSAEETTDTYVKEKWYMLDERYKGVPIMRAHGVAVDHDFISDEEIAKSQYYQDFIFKCGIPWWAGLRIPTDKEIWCLASLRTISQGPFGSADKDHLLLIKPHLSRALTLHKAVQKSRSNAVLSILEGTSMPAFAFAATGKVIAFNALAQTLLGDGLTLSNDCLCAADTADDIRLQQLVASGVARHPYAKQVPSAAIVRRPGKRPLVVRMLSLSEKLCSDFDGVAAIALITDPQAVAPNVEATLRILFNLTGAEARLATHIVAGTSLREAAEHLEIEEATARQYVKQVMAKSETHRQSEFVALATRLLHPAIRRDR